MKSLNPQERFELLSAYVDQELGASDRQLVEQWLREDSDYRQQYKQLLQVQKLLVDLPIVNAVQPEHVVNQVMAKIAKRSQRRWGLVALGIALITAGWGNYHYQQIRLAEATEEQLILAMEIPIIPLPSLSER